ncbi:OsmC family protein [Actinocorallia longicatena]|uniref:OsmC-like protein n=1 Tax=Actinocorallia longicatena TaxID=111803 RepID=A0ABP6QBK8_9ACTN
MGSVRVERTEDGFAATNERGARIEIGGKDADGVFSPVELLLAALGGCELLTVEPLTAKRGHRLARLAATVEAEKSDKIRIGRVTITYDVEAPLGDDKADEVFRAVAERVHEGYCTVGQALKNETPVVQKLP